MKVIIKTDEAPSAVGVYNQGVIVGNLLFISGQLGINPKAKDPEAPDAIKEETEQVMKNIGAILKAAGCTFEDVVKCSVFVKDIAQAKCINEVYKSSFKDPATVPAREFVEVSNIPGEYNLEISAIAQVNLVGKTLSNLSR